MSIPITELYTDTIQGEGSTIGKLCSFVRFTGCHRSCSWCDTPHTWRKGEVETTKMTVEEVVTELYKGKARTLILTGGEPLLHQDKPYFRELIEHLKGWDFEIETEGVFPPNAFITELAQSGRLQINCSPKLSCAGMGDLSDEYSAQWTLDSTRASVSTSLNSLPLVNERQSSLMQLAVLGAIFKFVVEQRSDVEEALALLKKAEVRGKISIYLMPQGQTKQEQLDRMDDILDLAIEYGVNFSPRVHVLRWNDKRAV